MPVCTIKKLSLWLDLRILVGTIKAVLFSKNGEKPLEDPTLLNSERVDNKVVALPGKETDSTERIAASISSQPPREVDFFTVRRRAA